MKKKLQQLSIHRLIGLSFALLVLLTTANIAHSDEWIIGELVKIDATKSAADMLPDFEGYCLLREVKTLDPDEEGKTHRKTKKPIPLYLGENNQNKDDDFLSWLQRNLGKKILTQGYYDRITVGNNDQPSESGQTDTEATDQSYIAQSLTEPVRVRVFKAYYLAIPTDELEQGR